MLYVKIAKTVICTKNVNYFNIDYNSCESCNKPKNKYSIFANFGAKPNQRNHGIYIKHGFETEQEALDWIDKMTRLSNSETYFNY